MAFIAPTVTFTPLSRGRFRCNQTKRVLRQAQVADYRAQRENAGRKRPKDIPVLQAQSVPKVSGWYSFLLDDTDFECPKCSAAQIQGGNFKGPTTCRHCGAKFIVT